MDPITLGIAGAATVAAAGGAIALKKRAAAQQGGGAQAGAPPPNGTPPNTAPVGIGPPPIQWAGSAHGNARAAAEIWGASLTPDQAQYGNSLTGYEQAGYIAGRGIANTVGGVLSAADPLLGAGTGQRLADGNQALWQGLGRAADANPGIPARIYGAETSLWSRVSSGADAVTGAAANPNLAVQAPPPVQQVVQPVTRAVTTVKNTLSSFTSKLW